MTDDDFNSLPDYDKPEIVIKGWLEEFSTERRVGDGGSVYYIIPNSERRVALQSLAKTLVSQGYKFEDLYSNSLRLKLLKLVWKDDKITKMTRTEIRQARKNLDDEWTGLVSVYSGIKILRAEEEIETQKVSDPIPGHGKILKSKIEECAPTIVDEDFMSLFPDSVETK